MKWHLDLSTLVLLGALPLAAIPAEPPLPPDGPATAKEEPTPLFDTLDSNHDEYLNRDEAKRSALVNSRFKELDTDADGRISEEEYKKGMQPKL